MNTKPKFTAGPWVKKVVFPQGERAYHAIKAEGHSSFLLRVYSITRDEELGNANLVSAAPDMYAALELITRYMEESHSEEVNSDHHGDGPEGCSYCRAIKQARAALKKAEGEYTNAL